MFLDNIHIQTLVQLFVDNSSLETLAVMPVQVVLDKIPRHWSKWYWTRSPETPVQVVLDKIPAQLVQVVLDNISGDTGPSGTVQDPQRHRSKWYWTRSLDTDPSGTG